MTDADICEQSEGPGQAADRIAAQDGIPFADAMKRVEAWLIVNDGATLPHAAGPYAWSCATCTDLGWIDQRAGGPATSGRAVCPDCGNPHGGSHP